MGQPANINPRIIEALYVEGLMLSDEVRDRFDISKRAPGDSEDITRVAISCEALRTTTRMMHAVAWLLNQRAYLRGEVSEFQIRRHGRIADNLPLHEPARLALLDAEMRDLVLATERFYARLVRLDGRWRAAEPEGMAISRLRERLARAVG